jgi:hypothetical protein
MADGGDGRRRRGTMNLPARMNSMTLVENRLNSFASGDSSGRSLDYNLGLPPMESGSLKLSGRDLLDILTAFTSNTDAPLTPKEDQLAAAQTQDKRNTQYLANPDQKDMRANMFQRGDMNANLGSSMKFQELGRCAPVGGAFNEVYAAGYDDLGYTVPSPVDPETQAAQGSYQQVLQAQVHDPMTFERILLSGKNTGLEKKKDEIQKGAVVGRRHTPPLKRNQARTGYKHKPKKPHPAVEKARRDGINTLIEDLREIVPEGGWTDVKVKRSTSLRDAMEGLHQGKGTIESPAAVAAGRKPDKRTKRAVLMDAIASIEALQNHVDKLQQENEALAAGGSSLSPSTKETFPRAPSTDGKAFEEAEMKKVHVEIALKHPIGKREGDKSNATAETTTALLVKIAYFDRRGFLADQCVAIRSLDMNIKSAELPPPNRNGFVQDIFETDIDKAFETEEEAATELEGLREQLKELLLETQSLYYQGVKSGEKRARTEA